MKIANLKCKKCKAEYETLESVPKENLVCPGCGTNDFDYKITDKDFEGCGGGCSSCDSCH